MKNTIKFTLKTQYEWYLMVFFLLKKKILSIQKNLIATRACENCEMIREHEKHYENYSLPFLLKEVCSYFDAATMSGKKDNLINIGGFLALRDE